MITYDLTAIDLCDMLYEYHYPDADIEHASDSKFSTLTSKKAMTYAYVWTQENNTIVITKPVYQRILDAAEPNGATALAIVATPDGIFEFNLSVLKLDFEAYSDGDYPDVMVAELPFAKGKRILEFYPDFDSQEEYLDALMGDAQLSDDYEW
jgi:hypothetical protein